MSNSSIKNRTSKQSPPDSATRRATIRPPRRQRQINFGLLIATFLVVAGASIVWYVLAQRRHEQLAVHLQAHAERLESEENWSKAYFYQQQYLQVQPNDFAGRLKLVEIAKELALKQRNTAEFTQLLYETIGIAGKGHASDEIRMRSWLAERLLTDGQFKAAIEEADEVIKHGDESQQASALRIRALAQFYDVPQPGLVSDLQRREELKSRAVLADLIKAIEANPTDTGLAGLAASLIRQDTTLVDEAVKDPIEYADGLMNRLVENSSASVDSLVTRYQYRKENGLPGALEDLDAALKTEPSHYEANFLSGMEAFYAGDEASLEKAKGYFEQAIASNPQQESAYLMQARLLQREGDQDGAISLLKNAIQSLPSSAFEVKLTLGDLLIADERLKEAESFIQSLHTQVDSQLSRFSSQQRSLLSNRCRLLEARLCAASGDKLEALSLFRSVASSPEQAGDRVAAGIARQANQGAANLLGQLGQWDQVAKELAELTDGLWGDIEAGARDGGVALREARLGAAEQLLESYKQSRIQAAEAYLHAGQTSEARSQLDTLTANLQSLAGDHRFPSETLSLPPQAIEAMLLVELSTQLEEAPQRRQWEEFQHLLNLAQKAAPDSVRVFVAELKSLQAQDQDTPSSAEAIEQLLARGAEQFAENGLYWKVASQAYLAINEQAQADAAIKRYMKVETNKTRQAEGWVSFLSQSNRLEEAKQWLADRIVTADEDSEELALKRLEIQLLAHAGDAKVAVQKAAELGSNSNDRTTLLMALEMAISQNDWKLAEKFQNQLAEKKLIAEVDQNYFLALRQLSRFDELRPREKVDLSKLISSLRSKRPLWRQGAVLAARYAESRGDFGKAIEDYELALTLGERRPKILERLALHLYRSGQYDRAQQVIDRLFTDEEVSLGAESLAISTAIKRQRFADGIRLARRSVEEHPKDPARRVWLYNVLAADGKVGEAEEVLVEARSAFEESPLIWNAYFSHLLRVQKTAEAERVLRSLPRAIAENTFQRAITLAQGYELLGKLDEAKVHYLEAIQLKPTDANVQLKYASMLLRSDPAEARTQYEAILEKHPDNDDARRKLAALLAANGPSADWNRIDELISESTDSNDVVDRRLRAILLTRRGRSISERATNCELARRILVGIVDDSSQPADDTDRLLLAGAYEQEGILKREPAYFESARRELRSLIDRADAPDRYSNLYLTFLLRSIETLGTIEEDSQPTRDAFLRDANDQIASLRSEANIPAGDRQPLRELATLGLEVRLLKAEGKLDSAVESLNTFASEQVKSETDEAKRARLILGLGSLYSLVDAHDLAEPLYRELTAIAPGARLLLSQALIQQGKSADAINLFLDDNPSNLSPTGAAGLASVLAASDANSDSFSVAWPAISSSLEQHSDNVELLLAVAVLHVTRGNQDAAIELFRRSLEIAPENTLALNNLATLLGERGADRPEALRLIGRAIEVAGREPALLDTQGTIQLQSGDAEAAIASLEESIVSVNVDPRYYFHLAAAYLRGGKHKQAEQALTEARSRGIDRAVLTSADRALMQELEAGLKPPKTALTKLEEQNER